MDTKTETRKAKKVGFKPPKNPCGFGVYHTESGKPINKKILKEFYAKVLGPAHLAAMAEIEKDIKDGGFDLDDGNLLKSVELFDHKR